MGIFIDLIDIISTICIGICTAKILLNSNRHNVCKERLEKVYHPLFVIYEPYLYKKVPRDELLNLIKAFTTISAEYKLYISPELTLHMDNLYLYVKAKFPHQKEWINVCKCLDNEYDNLCQQTHIPIRSKKYRVRYQQYESIPAMNQRRIRLYFRKLMFTYTMGILFLAFYAFLRAYIKTS